MSYYAKILDGRIVNVIVAEEEFFNAFVDSSPGTWLKTSFNVKAGVYYDPNTGNPHPEQERMLSEDIARRRKNFARVDGFYDHVNDAFIDPKIFDSWILDTNTFLWKPPVDNPMDGQNWDWDENLKEWFIAPTGNG